MMIGIALCCAFLTKSVAAMVPGIGVVLYVVVSGRWRRVAATPGYALTGLGVAAMLILFLAAREWQGPGYLQAAWFNDFTAVSDPRWCWRSRAGFISSCLCAGFFAAGALLLLSPLALLETRGPIRQILLFSLCIVVATLAIFTCAASKLDHYILPALPFMAIAAAVTCRLALAHAGAVLRADGRYARLIAAALLLVAVVPIAIGVAGAVARRYYVPIVGEGARSGRYGALLDRIVPLADRPILVVDPGFDQVQPNYTPVLLAYRELWRARGVAIAHSIALTDADRQKGRLLASCDPAAVARITARGRDIGRDRAMRRCARRLMA